MFSDCIIFLYKIKKDIDSDIFLVFMGFFKLSLICMIKIENI